MRCYWPNDTPFLDAVRSHPNARCFYLTKENAEELLPEVLDFLREHSGVHLGECPYAAY